MEEAEGVNERCGNELSFCFIGVGERGEIDRRPILQQLVARP